MSGDWRDLCDAPDLRPLRNSLRVLFGNGRTHKVRVTEVDDGYLISGVVVDADRLADTSAAQLDAWTRNRHSRLIGFRVDHQSRLVGFGWTPAVGLTAEAFQLLVRAVAREADRLEFRMTGKDRH